MIQLEEQIEVSPDGKTVWVHALDGSTVGRFSKVFGMDIHTSITEQMSGAPQCLHCTHSRPTKQDWLEFCHLLNQHYSIKIAHDLIDFENGTP